VAADALDAFEGGWTTAELLRATAAPRCLKLIDFGRAVDLTLVPERTAFLHCFQDDKSPEMRDGKPWTYQVGPVHSTPSADRQRVVPRMRKLSRPIQCGRFSLRWRLETRVEFGYFIRPRTEPKWPDISGWMIKPVGLKSSSKCQLYCENNQIR